MTQGERGIGNKKHDVDMTEGSIVRLIVYFALPLLAGKSRVPMVIILILFVFFRQA